MSHELKIMGMTQMFRLSAGDSFEREILSNSVPILDYLFWAPVQPNFQDIFPTISEFLPNPYWFKETEKKCNELRNLLILLIEKQKCKLEAGEPANSVVQHMLADGKTVEEIFPVVAELFYAGTVREKYCYFF